MRYKFKQYLSMTLAVITLVTSIPIKSYAANTDNNIMNHEIQTNN